MKYIVSYSYHPENGKGKCVQKRKANNPIENRQNGNSGKKNKIYTNS